MMLGAMSCLPGDIRIHDLYSRASVGRISPTSMPFQFRVTAGPELDHRRSVCVRKVEEAQDESRHDHLGGA